MFKGCSHAFINSIRVLHLATSVKRSGAQRKNFFNPIMLSVQKLVKHTLKFLQQICKIFDVCLTILWTSGIEKLKCPMLAQSELELEFTD